MASIFRTQFLNECDETSFLYRPYRILLVAIKKTFTAFSTPDFFVHVRNSKKNIHLKTSNSITIPNMWWNSKSLLLLYWNQLTTQNPVLSSVLWEPLSNMTSKEYKSMPKVFLSLSFPFPTISVWISFSLWHK